MSFDIKNVPINSDMRYFYEANLKVKSLLSLAACMTIVLGPSNLLAESLNDAARQGDIDGAKQLIVSGTNVEEIDGGTDLTPLVEAALGGHKDMVLLLIENGAKPDGRDGKGFTALHAAAHMGHVEIVQLLIEYGVNVNDQENTATVTPLHLAAERNYLDVAEALLRQGAALDLKTESGHTPVIMAVLNGHVDMVKMLREHGASCSFRSKRFSEYCLNAGNPSEEG